MQCPKCDKPLAEVYLREVPIEQCQTCEGIWLDSGEFQLIVEREKAEEGWLSRAFKSWLAGTKKEKELQKTLNNSSTPPAEPPSMPMES